MDNRYVVKESSLKKLGDAIRVKAGIEDPLIFPDGFSDAVRSIETPDDGADTINFYDCDGTLLYSYPVEAIQEMTELPELPTRPGLICQGWNYDLETLKQNNHAADVGATYITDDGKTRLHITLDADGMDVTLAAVCNGGAIVDWGDGTNTDNMDSTSGGYVRYVSHQYESAGNYVISIGGYKTISFGSSSDITNPGWTTLKNCITEINLGENPYIFSDHAFDTCGRLSNITISKGFTRLGSYAFNNCFFLQALILPDSVKYIERNCVSKCYSISVISLPHSLTSTYGYASTGTNFTDTCISRLIVPDNVTDVSGSILAYVGSLFCAELTYAYIPGHVLSGAKNFFRSNKKLYKCVIGNDAEVIPEAMFYGCSVLPEVDIPDGVTSIGKDAFHDCTALTKINIPDGVTEIGDNAFMGCKNLTNIHIPDGVTKIPSFSDCYNLTKINIPDGVTSIGSFSNCRRLAEINIPDGVTSIGSFSSCYSLTNINIPDGVTSIGKFDGCYRLTKISIPDGVTSIASDTFKSCINLMEVNLGGGVTSLGSSAFSGCGSLTNLHIPPGVASISTYTFNSCYSMQYYDFSRHTAVPTLSSTTAFQGIPSTCEIRVPAALVDEWKAATNWTTHASKIVGV